MSELTDLVWILIAQAPEPAAPGREFNPLFDLLPWLAIGVLFYMMLLRPERRKRAELEVMLSNLKKNDRIVTAGGIHGTVVNAATGSAEVTLRIDDNNNTRIRVTRSSIARFEEPPKASEGSESQ